MKKIFLLLFLSAVLIANVFSQNDILVKGYVSAEENQGFISDADVTLRLKDSDLVLKSTKTNDYGEFSFDIKSNRVYTITVKKNIYKDIVKEVDSSLSKDGKNIFLKFEMIRKPGYTFEISLTEVRTTPYAPVDGITGALIEVYNNTTGELTTKFINDRPDFNIELNKGNHYTILIRKDGYLAKELEAYLNINGCIICFHGVSKMQPGIKTRLSKNNTVGKYLANIELDKVFKGKKIKINNIYYQLNKANITETAAKELDNIARILQINPKLVIELGSHTDSRGSDSYNMKLSTARAKAAVQYLTKIKKINPNRITYKGYGETELTNKCKNGVPCSEELHAANRRTEIKILNILQNNEGEMIPLKVIKDNKRMEDRIKNILDYGSKTVEIKDGKIPDEILKDLNKNKKEKNIKKENIKTPDNPEKKISVSGIESDFTGFKIALISAAKPLPKGHILMKSIPDIKTYFDKKTGKTFYLIGSYDTYEKAVYDLEDNWKKKYKEAHIVKFKNGLKI